VSDLEPASETENLLPTLQPEPRRRGLLLVRIGVVLVTVGVVVASTIAAYGYVFGDAATRSGVDGKFASALRRSATTTTERPTTTTAPPTTTTTLPKQPEPPILVLPPLPGGSIGMGARGPEVQVYELRLKQLHFDPGPVDGYYDQKTRYAVEAVEKLFGGTRDGRIGEGVRFALSTFHWPKTPLPKPEPDRVEIDLGKQVLTLYRTNQVALITTTSTGSGKRFCGGDDGCQYAVTPPGRYTFTWHHNGWRDGSLGHLYNPYYFNGGIAVHGYTSVPVYPASHGCSRIPMHIAEYFPSMVFKGMPVYVLGAAAPPTGTASPPPPPPPPATSAPATTAPPVSAATVPPTTKPKTPPTTKPSPPTTKPSTASSTAP
jgi:peptidoglycan hydrolase-like protein with peptidoglycan-binding domain